MASKELQNLCNEMPLVLEICKDISLRVEYFTAIYDYDGMKKRAERM